MISRRYFLAALPLGVPFVTAAAKIAARQSLHVGCQTNAWRIDARDFSQVLAVLKEIKELGYEGFETGFRNLQGQFADASRARRAIEQTGLAFFGAHIFLTQYDAQTNIAPFDLISNVVDGAARLGAQRLILSGGPAPDQAALERKIAALDAAGKYAKAKGLRRVSYHNHAPEFSSGGAEIEALYRETDPELTGFVLDCGHAHRAGINVAEFFARHHARIDGLHLRDYRGDSQVPLGQGDFDLRALAAAARRAKWNGWVLNEEERADGSKPGAEAVRPARQALRQTFSI